MGETGERTHVSVETALVVRELESAAADLVAAGRLELRSWEPQGG